MMGGNGNPNGLIDCRDVPNCSRDRFPVLKIYMIIGEDVLTA